MGACSRRRDVERIQLYCWYLRSDWKTRIDYAFERARVIQYLLLLLVFVVHATLFLGRGADVDNN